MANDKDTDDWQKLIPSCLVAANHLSYEMALMGYSPDAGIVTSAALLVHHAQIYGEPMERVLEFIRHMYLAYSIPQEMREGMAESLEGAREEHKKETKH